MLSDYLARLGAQDRSIKQQKIDGAVDKMRRKFEAFPTALTVMALFPDEVNKRPVKIRVVYDSAMKQANPERRHSLSFIVHPDYCVKSGTIMYAIDGRDYLALNSLRVGEIHEQGSMARINQNLKWMAEGEVHSSPAVIFTTTYTATSVVETQIMTTPAETLKIAIPINESTRTIKRDMRFLVNGSPYKVRRVDDYTDEGIFNLIVKEDLIQENDNIELGIADYVEGVETPIQPYIKGDSSISFGMLRTFEVVNLVDVGAVIGFGLVDASLVDVLESTPTSVTLRLNKKASSGDTIQIQAELDDGTELTHEILVRSLL